MNPADLVSQLGGLVVGVIIGGIFAFFFLILGLGGLARLMITIASKPNPNTSTDYISAIAMLVGSAYLLFLVDTIAHMAGIIR